MFPTARQSCWPVHETSARGLVKPMTDLHATPFHFCPALLPTARHHCAVTQETADGAEWVTSVGVTCQLPETGAAVAGSASNKTPVVLSAASRPVRRIGPPPRTTMWRRIRRGRRRPCRADDL